MATIPVLDYIANVVEDTYVNLKTAIGIITKNLQEFADSVALDPDADNSNLAFDISRQLYSPFYFNVYTREVTTDFNTWDKGSGQQPCLCYGIIEINNETVSIHDMQLLGRVPNGDRWDWLSSAEIETVKELISEALNGLNPVFTPDNPVYYRYSSYLNGAIVNSTDNSNITFTDELPEKSIEKYSVPFVINTANIVYDEDTDYWSDFQTSYGAFNCTVKQPLVVVTTQESFASDYVANNGATNNYVSTYLTLGGNLKVYYGDNYIIYVVPTGVKVTYDIMFNVTKEVTEIINTDNPDMPQIVVPTYEENKHDPEPPTPESDDDYVDMGLGVETDGMAMYNMAVITRDELIQLITDFETNADTGLSFIPHVLGLYKLGIESSQLLTTKSEQIKLHKEPNGTSAFTSVDNYNIVEEQLTVIDCGSITVDREVLLTNTFYDYSPYSTYEMFIPGCGWITLPDTIVGRTISVSIVFDLTTCSCKGVVRTEGQLLGGSGTTLATVNGIIGSSVPLSINETGLQRAAIFNGSTQAAMALGTAFLGAGLGNPYMGASGLAMAAGALADNHVAGNTTYTNTKGGATDYSVFGDGYKAVLKITRPVVEIPDNYGHTVGFVVNEYGMLSDFHGFTVCVNPHIHIPATSDEKEEIKRLLESGVILPDGE